MPAWPVACEFLEQGQLSMFGAGTPFAGTKCSLASPVYDPAKPVTGVKVKDGSKTETLDTATTDVAAKFECATGFTGIVTAATCTDGILAVSHSCIRSEWGPQHIVLLHLLAGRSNTQFFTSCGVRVAATGCLVSSAVYDTGSRPTGVKVADTTISVDSGGDAKAGFGCDTGYTSGSVTSAVCTDGVLSLVQTCGQQGGCALMVGVGCIESADSVGIGVFCTE